MQYGQVYSAEQCQRNHKLVGGIACEPCPASAPYSLGVDKTSCTPCSVVKNFVTTALPYPHLVFN